MLLLAKLTVMRLDWLSVKSAILMQNLAGMKIPFKPTENKTFFPVAIRQICILLISA